MKQTATFLLATLFSWAASAQVKLPATYKPAATAIQDTVKKQEGPQLLVLKGDMEAFNALFEIIGRSDDSHQKVESVKNWILAQLAPQLPKKEQPKK